MSGEAFVGAAVAGAADGVAAFLLPPPHATAPPATTTAIPTPTAAKRIRPRLPNRSIDPGFIGLLLDCIAVKPPSARRASRRPAAPRVTSVEGVSATAYRLIYAI